MLLKTLAAFCFIALLSKPSYSSGKQSANLIFINETSDHRFDESIRMSIMASQKRTGVQNVVVISNKNLSPTQLFEELGIGKGFNGKGILYFHSPESKTLDIEVAYGLEGVLPDAMIKGLELAAKSFIYTDQYQDFWAELINTINIQISKSEKVDFDFSKYKYLSGGAGISSRDFEASLEQFRKESVATDDKSRFKAQQTIEKSLALYLESMALGMGTPDLDLITEESRIKRDMTALTNFQLYRNYKMYQEAGVKEVLRLKDLAFVFFNNGHPVLPVVLRLESGVWRIHEPLSWSLFQRFEDSMNVFAKFPFPEGTLKNYVEKNLGPPLYKAPVINVDTISQNISKKPNGREFYFKLFLLDEARSALESSETTEDLWPLLDTYQNLGQFTKFVNLYEKLADLYPKEEKVRRAAKFYRENAIFKDPDWRLKR